MNVLAEAKASEDQINNLAALGRGERIDYAMSLIASKASVDDAIKAGKMLKTASANSGQSANA